MNKLEKILNDDNKMYKAFLKSKNNRSYKASALTFEKDVLSNLETIKIELLNKTYKVSGYTKFKVYEPKERTILACKFKDKVVQHILCDNFLLDRFEELCILDNYSAQRNKGTGFARKRVIYQMKRFYNNYKMDGYIFKGDISKYYYNIDHDIAKQIMHRYFEEEFHWLIDEFIDSTDNPGIALGNQINTIVSGMYLHGLDNLITKKLNYPYYGRYADDFFIFDSDKERLKLTVKMVEKYLGILKLKLNPKSQIVPFKNGLNFIGFHFYIKNGDIVIRLNNKKKNAYRRKFNKMYKLVESRKIEFSKLLVSYISWKSHVKLCNNHGIFKYYDNKIKELLLKMTIENGYYIAECTSTRLPYAHKDLDTFYLPIDVEKTDEGYKYKEYRFNLPITENIPQDLIEYMANELDEYRKSLAEVGVL